MTLAIDAKCVAVGFLAGGLPTFAATPDTSDAATLLSKADHHATMAGYRGRMRTDPKRAISYFTQANHCDQKAQAFRTAALQVQGEPTYRR